jgi:UDP-glucose 4-epimerase
MMDARRVLITGGAGMIGSTIAEQLAQTDVAEILIVDNFVRGRLANLTRATETGKVRVIEGDIRDARFVADAMQGVDLLFHQAAIRITQCAEEPREALEVLVDGTFNVLEAAVNAGVQKVVAASSASAYGLAVQFPTPESHHPYANRTLYGAAKTFNEGLLRSFNEMYGLPYVALRYFNVYGPKMDIHGVYTEVLIRWMERIEAGLPPIILGDGLQSMDFVYVEDVARANILAAQSECSDEVFNVASGTETTLVELAAALTAAMGASVEPAHGPERTVNAVSRRLADTSRAQERLGFEAQVSLTEGLRRLVAWWRDELCAEARSAAS